MKCSRIHAVVFVSLPLLLGGCQLQPVKPPEPAPTANSRTLTRVKQLEAKGRYGEAINLLEKAIGEDGKADLYTSTLREIRLRQKRVEEELQDQLLISRTAALRNQIPLLERLIRSNPDVKHYVEQLGETYKQLLKLRQNLSDCGWRHFKKNNALAKGCLTLALSLQPNKEDEQLINHLLEEQSQNRRKSESEERAQRETAWKRRVRKRLEEATQFYDSGQISEARRVLKVLLKEDPNNTQAKALLNEVETRLKSYLENLIAAGDRLYREGEIEGARATWRAALTLDPQDKRARDKMERAQRVLDNLENLRRTESQP